jgi:hypothetical protein
MNKQLADSCNNRVCKLFIFLLGGLLMGRMVTFHQKGNFTKLNSYLERIKEGVGDGILNKYGELGLEALRSVTPVRTGLTRDSWYYQIERKKGSVAIRFLNSNVQNGQNIAIILDVGHGTRNGGWVAGRHYIEPAIQPVFDELAAECFQEIKGK